MYVLFIEECFEKVFCAERAQNIDIFMSYNVIILENWSKGSHL